MYKILSTQPIIYASSKILFFTLKTLINLSPRDTAGSFAQFEPIALVEHQGQISQDGATQGHYICDLEDKETLKWFRTNDNQNPVPIDLTNVTKNPVVVLYIKIHFS